MIRATIDIGSNSVLLLIAEILPDSSLKELANESRVTGLGRGLNKTGEFMPEAIDETKAAIEEYLEIASSMGIDLTQMLITATEASRVAKNSSDLYQPLVEKFKIKVLIISGEAEAFYTAKGVCAMAKLDVPEVAIVDVGGASSEIMSVNIKPFKLRKSISLPMGSVRATDWKNENVLLSKLESLWLDEYQEYDCKNAIFVAGTMTSLGAMFLGQSSFDGSKLDGFQISFAKVKNFVAKIKELTPDELKKSYPFLEKRATSIVAGAEVALFIGDRLGLESIRISPYGLRYGTLLSEKIEDHYVERCFK